jgi:hypothetical protein
VRHSSESLIRENSARRKLRGSGLLQHRLIGEIINARPLRLVVANPLIPGLGPRS